MKTLLISLLLASAPVLAADEKKEGAEEKMDTPTFILHHVSDDDAYEFEIPWPGVESPKIELGKIFAGLKWETVPGACAAPVVGPLSAMPSLGRFIGGCRDFRPTKATLMMWIAALLLILAASLAVRRNKNDLVPRGVLPNVVEVLVLFVRDELVYKNIGKKEGDRYVPYLTTVFFFILFMNWLGLVPNFGSATGQLSVTLVFAIATFVLTQIAAIRSAGIGGFLSHLTAGTPVLLWPVMVPVEVLGLFTKPFALMIRLFANMLAGHMVLFFIIGLIFMLHPGMAVVSIPLATPIYLLEIFVGILQAYIFVLLSALFIGQSVEMGAHGHAHDDHAEPLHH